MDFYLELNTGFSHVKQGSPDSFCGEGANFNKATELDLFFFGALEIEQFVYFIQRVS